MTESASWFHSPRVLDRAASALLVIDLQERLLPALGAAEHLLWNASRLIRGAQALEVPVGATVQYPQGLGKMADPIAIQLPETPQAKRAFSSAACRSVIGPWAEQGVRQIVVCGIETHVCVLQTVLDLMGEGFDLYVVADAVGARGQLDHRVALDRMRSEGATVSTTEATLFEWCRNSEQEAFRQISALVKEPGPEALAKP
jgi:nicotinamidase-related amidase